MSRKVTPVSDDFARARKPRAGIHDEYGRVMHLTLGPKLSLVSNYYNRYHACLDERVGRDIHVGSQDVVSVIRESRYYSAFTCSRKTFSHETEDPEKWSNS